jgi:hypothetical protein
MNSPKIVAAQPEPHVAWGVDGSLLAVGTEDELIVIDLAERQDDSAVVVDITQGPDGLAEGVHGPYVLSAEIPPRRYREEVSEGEEGETTVFVPEPLDVASVVLHLWTVVTVVNDTETTETEEI